MVLPLCRQHRSGDFTDRPICRGINSCYEYMEKDLECRELAWISSFNWAGVEGSLWISLFLMFLLLMGLCGWQQSFSFGDTVCALGQMNLWQVTLSDVFYHFLRASNIIFLRRPTAALWCCWGSRYQLSGCKADSHTDPVTLSYCVFCFTLFIFCHYRIWEYDLGPDLN